LFALGSEQGIGTNEQPTRSLSDGGRNRYVEVARVAGIPVAASAVGAKYLQGL